MKALLWVAPMADPMASPMVDQKDEWTVVELVGTEAVDSEMENCLNGL